MYEAARWQALKTGSAKQLICNSTLAVRSALRLLLLLLLLMQ